MNIAILRTVAYVNGDGRIKDKSNNMHTMSLFTSLPYKEAQLREQERQRERGGREGGRERERERERKRERKEGWRVKIKASNKTLTMSTKYSIRKPLSDTIHLNTTYKC